MSTLNPYQPPQSNPASPSDSRGPDDKLFSELNTFVFQNTDYYEKFYPRLLQGDKALGFNWAAAIFTTPWLAYRKMYAWVALYILASFGLGILIALALPRLPFYGPLYLAIPAVGLLIRFLMGRFANYLYLSSARKKVQRIIDSTSDTEARAQAMDATGGTSGLACTLVLVLSGILNIVSSRL